MKVQRGDVVLTRVPHAAGGRGKKRPAVVIQANGYNQSERHLIDGSGISISFACAELFHPCNSLAQRGVAGTKSFITRNRVT